MTSLNVVHEAAKIQQRNQKTLRGKQPHELNQQHADKEALNKWLSYMDLFLKSLSFMTKSLPLEIIERSSLRSLDLMINVDHSRK